MEGRERHGEKQTGREERGRNGGERERGMKGDNE